MNPFRSLLDYEQFVYTLQQQYPQIVRSTLLIARHGRSTATLTGELLFADEHRLTVYEIFTWDTGAVIIQRYSYEVWHDSEKLYWYDPQPHPNDPSLASTNPHHKHIPPNIKRHRLPAPELHFDRPNLPFLIEEIARLHPQ